MKRSQKFIACLVIAVGLLVIAVPCLMLWVFREVIAQTNGPTTREQAVAMGCPIELPASASNVQFASLAGGLQDCEQHVRFEAPLADCHETAKRLLTRFSSSKASANYTSRPISHPDSQHSRRLRTDWFDVDAISHGVVLTGEQSRPTIWIDEQRGLLYYYFID